MYHYLTALVLFLALALSPAPAPAESLDDGLMKTQSEWIKLCLRHGESGRFTPEQTAYCIQQASAAIRIMRHTFAPETDPTLVLAIRYMISACVTELKKIEEARTEPLTFMEEMNTFPRLASCTVLGYEALITKAGGRDELKRKLEEGMNKREL